MRILCASDLHGDFSGVPPGALPFDADVCAVAGDLTDTGIWDIVKFSRAEGWLRAMGRQMPTLWVPGNHDVDIRPATWAHLGGYGADVRCALDRMVTLNARGETLTAYGCSLSPCYSIPALAKQWWYMTADHAAEAAYYDTIPPGVDLIISHCPPLDCLDGEPDEAGGTVNIGSGPLRDYIERCQPKAVVCGHCHSHGGESAMIGETTVYNVAGVRTVIEV